MQIIVISQALPGILRFGQVPRIRIAMTSVMAALSSTALARFRNHMEASMRHIALAALAACSFALLTMAAAEAAGTRHPFCLQGDEYPGLSACTFDTYAQCQATASGRKVYCIANPYFVGDSDDPYVYGNRYLPFPPNYYPVQPGYYPRRYY
jgi:hypothetical protein